MRGFDEPTRALDHRPPPRAEPTPLPDGPAAPRAWRLLHEPAEGAPVLVERVEPARDVGEGEARALLCRACGHAITSTEARIEVNGQHLFVRLNPHGYLHEFGCFASAPGCRSVGIPTRQNTWFAGHHWHTQDCANCDAHLGWLFFTTSATSPFYGLLIASLIDPSP